MSRSLPVLFCSKNSMSVSRCLEWFQKVGLGQSILVGICLGIGFIVPILWWVGLISVWWVINALQEKVSIQKFVAVFFLIWTIKSLFAISWLWYTYPIDWVGNLSRSIQPVLIFMYWISGAMWLGMGGVVFVLVCLWAQRRLFSRQYQLLILIPCMWLLAEIAGTTIFSFFTGGAGSFIQSYFSFSMIGYLFAVTPLGLYLAGFLHVYGLTIVMVTFGIILYVLSKRTSVLMLGSVCLILYLGCVFINLNGVYVSSNDNFVISIDTQFDAEFLATDEGLVGKANIVAEAVITSVDLKPDVVLLPEDSRYLSSQFNDDNVNQAMAAFQFIHGDTQSIVIDSGRYATPEGLTVLRANVFDGRSDTLRQFDKQYLVPQGEYIPTLYGWIVRLLGYGDALDTLAQDSAYRRGPLVQTADIPNYLPGILFCFESVNPKGVSDLMKTRPLPFVAHPISHAWFHNPTFFWRRLDVMLQVQARYAGVPIVSAGNMASGKIYLPSGEIQSGKIVGEGERYQLREFRF